LDKASNNLEGRPTIPEVTEVEVTGEGEKMPVDIPPVAPDQMVAMLKALEDAPDLAAGCIAALPLVRVLPSNAADEPRIRVAFDSFIDDTNKFKSPTPAQGVVFLRGVSDTKVQTVQNAILPSITAPASLQPLIDVRKGTDTKALKRIQPLIDKGISQLLGKDSTVPGILKRFKDDPDDPKLILELKKLYEATTLSKDDKLTHALAILLGHVVFKGKILEKDADGDSGYARYLKYLNDNNLPKPNIPDAPYVNYLFKPQSPAQILQQNFSSAATLQQAEKFLK
jgi:hypothetical protein